MDPITKKLESLAQGAGETKAREVLEANLTIRTGYNCPDVSLTEVAEQIARAVFDSRNAEVAQLHAALKVASEALEKINKRWDDLGLHIAPSANDAREAQAEILKLLNGVKP